MTQFVFTFCLKRSTGHFLFFVVFFVFVVVVVVVVLGGQERAYFT